MNSLRRTLLVAIATMGLMVGATLIAQAPAPVSKAADGGNYLDALAIAKADVTAAMNNAKSPETKLPADVAKTLSAKLSEVASEIDISGKAFREIDKSRHPEIGDPAQGIPATLKEQLNQAIDELQSGSVILEHSRPTENVNKPRKPVKDALQEATTKLIDARKLLSLVRASDPANQNPLTEQPGVNAPVPPSLPEEQDQKTLAAAQLRNDRAAARQVEHLQLAASGLAILLAGIAIALVFQPVGPVKKLRFRNHALGEELKLLAARRTNLSEEIEALKKEVADLMKTAARAPTSTKSLDPAPKDVWTGEERRRNERRKDPRSPSGEVEVDALAPPVPAKAVQIPRQPVGDYNDVRAMKAAGRAAEFQQLYPKQMTMTCANPSARNSGPFTELRFKEDHYGKFQAVEHGKETLLFPELNYDYSTGRKTLEGVFQYPEVESATFKLTQAASLEKRGEEWALTRQGVFQNG